MAGKTPKADSTFKLVMLGDSGVGKTSMMMRFTDDIFYECYITTIGVDFRIRTFTIDGKLIKLQIWDTAGQERFRTITKAYYQHSDGILFVYDVTDQLSFDHINEWIGDVDRCGDPNINKFLIGNKIDMIDRIKVTHEQGKNMADKLKMSFIETSARTSYNIDSAFELVARELLKKKKIFDFPTKVILDQKEEKVNKFSNCCS